MSSAKGQIKEIKNELIIHVGGRYQLNYQRTLEFGLQLEIFFVHHVLIWRLC